MNEKNPSDKRSTKGRFGLEDSCTKMVPDAYSTECTNKGSSNDMKLHAMSPHDDPEDPEVRFKRTHAPAVAKLPPKVAFSSSSGKKKVLIAQGPQFIWEDVMHTEAESIEPHVQPGAERVQGIYGGGPDDETTAAKTFTDDAPLPLALTFGNRGPCCD